MKTKKFTVNSPAETIAIALGIASDAQLEELSIKTVEKG